MIDEKMFIPLSQLLREKKLFDPHIQVYDRLIDIFPCLSPSPIQQADTKKPSITIGL